MKKCKINLKYFATLSAALLLLSACATKEKPAVQYMPHMANTANLKSQEGYSGFADGASNRLPPDGTIPRGFTPYRLASAEDAERALKNPLPFTPAVLKRGEEMFNTYCMVCHGDRGYGDGSVVPPFPIPKSLQSESMLKWGDGHLFHIITAGQGVMPSYATQILPQDRWAIIHYVRVLQRAEHPNADDIQDYKRKQGN